MTCEILNDEFRMTESMANAQMMRRPFGPFRHSGLIRHSVIRHSDVIRHSVIPSFVIG